MKILKFVTNKDKNMYYYQTELSDKKYSSKIENEVINIYPSVTYQTLIGFGGAITEASAYNYSLLSDEKKQKFLHDYFSENNYSLCRLTIGSCDFSLNSYSYSHKHDLSDFSIEPDLKYTIPLIKDALNINPNIKFLASPWSPPKFMKNTKISILGGKLLDKYKSTYAKYLAKYIKSYSDLGINIDYITIQNEPNAIQRWESCLYSPQEESDFIVNYLFPEFEFQNISTKILIYDHNKEKLFNRAHEEFSNEQLKNIVSGVAFHWYTGNHFENIKLCKEFFPDKLLIHSEGCSGLNLNNPYANEYANEIIGDLNSGANGFIDWNIFLDKNGGPSHIKNPCNSPIMMDSDNHNYFKMLSYYYIGHFSRFILPNAVRVANSTYSDNLKITSFKNPDNRIVIVILNKENYDMSFNLCINDSTFHDTIEKQSIITYII